MRNIFKKISRQILIGIIFLSIFLLIYKNTHDISFSSSLENIAYRWLLPLGLILIFAQSLFLSDDYKIIFLINFMAVIIALYSVEFILLNRKQNHIHRTAKERSNIHFDSRSVEQVIYDMRLEGIEVYPFSNGKYFEVDNKNFLSLAGISNAQIIHCNETGEWILFKSDEFGFNNPSESFKNNEIQIVAIGDSFTSGYCLPDSSSFISLIRKKYPKTINLGVTATGPLHQLAILKEYAIKLKPKVILWNFFEGNDLQELNIEISDNILKNYLKQGFDQNLIQKQLYIDKSFKENFNKRIINTKEKQINFKNFIFLDELRGTLGLYKENYIPKDIKLDVLKSILIMAKNVAEDWDGKLIFVYIPSVERFMGFKARYQVNQSKDKIFEIVKKLNIPSIDISKSIESHRDPLSLYNSRIGYHFNKKGYELLSEIILDSLRL
tara:strand:- start:87 stop:1400 length:1314 start_codon:yes stop_codon:yes gene_type:complete